MIKMTYCLKRLPEITREEFQRYWREHHAPMAIERADVLGIRRYIQCHTIPDDAKVPLNQTIRQSRGATEAYDGVAELWFDSTESLLEASLSPEGVKAAQELLEDERKFIDLANSSIFFTEEHTIIPLSKEV